MTTQAISLLMPVAFASIAVMCLVYSYGCLVDWLMDRVTHEEGYINGLLLFAVGILAFIMGVAVT